MYTKFIYIQDVLRRDVRPFYTVHVDCPQGHTQLFLGKTVLQQYVFAPVDKLILN